ncbi:MAG: ThuA domain-containing protein [Anditalea sp.]
MLDNKMKNLMICCFLIGLSLISNYAEAHDKSLQNLQVLVYTKNGEGFVHDNIPYAVKSIQKLGEEHGFKVTVSDDPSLFTEENLKEYNLLVFPSTNNDVFDNDEQRVAFRRYIQAGGGFVGIHSVMGTERNWEWFKKMIGGTFVWHTRFQNYQLKVIDPTHPSVENFPKVWEKEDECYFMKEVYPGIKVIMAHNLESLDQDQKERIDASSVPFSKLYPAVWYQDFDGGHVWVTALGHQIKDYEDPTFMQHILQGIQYIADQSGTLDYSKAYATSRDVPVQY